MDDSLPYRVSYSVGNEQCRKCLEQIGFGCLQIAIMVQSHENDCKCPTWYHQQCFFKTCLPPTAAAFDGFSQLRYVHQLAIKKDLGLDDTEIKSRESAIYKADVPGFSGEYLVHRTTVMLEEEIRFQNESYFKVYDYIVENVPKDEQIEILNFNRQMVPNTDEQIAHHLTDMVYFGALRLCNSCKRGQLVFCNRTYKCTNGSEWTTCGHEDKEPSRIYAKIPPALSTKYSFLTVQCKVRKRALHSFKLVDEQGNDLVYGSYKKPPLFNMEFVLVGTFKKARADVERLIKKLGGKIGTAVHDRVAAIISTMDEVQKMDKQMMEACKYSIQVVNEEFLDDIQTPDSDPILCIISKSISDWGGDPYARIDEVDDVAIQRDTEFYTKSLPEKITHKWDDGGVVDVESGLEENAKVFSIEINKRKLLYSVVLGLVDIEHNKNSYYRMQLLESNDQNLYWLFKSWGRVGTVIGSKCLENYGSLDDALDKFNSIYEDKTGNKFGTMTFQKQPKKFYRLDVEVGMPRVPQTLIATKLDAPVYELMQMLFDVGKMENMMCGCDLDLKQMPLGKISAKQIKMAMTTLCTIGKLIHRNASVHELREASNQFYTLIPHSFGVSRPPVIGSMETIHSYIEKLESLLNMETIYSFLEGENGEVTNPFDACYSKMNATIVPIAKDSYEFQLLRNTVQNTHGPTHNHYTLEVLEIFKVVRHGEGDHYPYDWLNRQLLWHGSRRMNFANILSKGLKIAPPEAPASGYMFGKGIYFADVVSKSGLYCFTDPNNDIGLMLMCEVALGNSMNLTNAFYVVDQPNATFQSVKGVGYYYPSMTQYINGVLAPCYGMSASGIHTALQYNEYIVYDPNQVQIKYLFKMKFHFRN